MSEEKKLTLGKRQPLGLKGGVERGKVRQSFSHGRTNTVVVERKRKRVTKKETGPEADAKAAEATPAEAEVTAAPVDAPKEKATPPKAETAAPAGRKLSSEERQARQDAVQGALKEAEQERLRAAEEARRRADEEAKERAEAEKRAREAKRAEEEARQAAELKREETGRSKKPPVAKEKPAADDGDGRGARLARKDATKQKRQTEAPDRSNRRGVDNRRRGKLTVTRALEGGDDTRVRSLAALKRAREKEKRAQQQSSAPREKKVREVTIPEAITVQELSNRMAEKGVAVIKVLMNMGMMATINQTLDQDTAELVVAEFGHTPKRVSESDVEIGLVGDDDSDSDLESRAPIVTVMGHVDHGKTSLLDALRDADVADGEAGGITQHIGAYQVKVGKDQQKVTFLDTPGHEAFTAMRARGAMVTDLVILVVAADDGIMPQTIEAISHAKSAEVPMIVAINKMDLEGADPNRVRTELLQHEVIVEEMSGDVIDVPVSAIKRTGLDQLLESVLLQAEIMELTANPNREAEGVVIEAQLDKGRGPVATVLVKRGTLRVGDIFVAGAEWGKVRALINDRGQQVSEAGPSVPVEVLGLGGTPAAGDDFSVVENEARAREVSAYRQEQVRKKRMVTAPTSLETMFSALKEKQAAEYPVVIKADVQGSAEAIATALEKAGNDDIKGRVILAGVGGVSEADVALAKASGAVIIGFNVRANKQAREAAEVEGVLIQYYSIIYDVIDDVKAAMAGQLGPQIIEKVTGMAEVRDVFTAGKAGRAAGCYVAEGVIKRTSHARILRDGVIVYTGKLSSLRRFKDDVNEVKVGLECGMTFENFIDVKPNDTVETYDLEERERVI